MWALAWASLLPTVWTFIFLRCLHKETICIPEEISNTMKGIILPVLSHNIYRQCQFEGGYKMLLFPWERLENSKLPWTISNKLIMKYTPEGTSDSDNRPSASATSRQGVQRSWSSCSRRHWEKWQTTGWSGLLRPRRHWDSEANGCSGKVETDL